MYQIGLTSAASKEFKGLPLRAQKLISEIFDSEFSRDPYSQKLDSKKLQKPLHDYRLRVGDYRILYVLEGTYIRVYKIAHRKDAYR